MNNLEIPDEPYYQIVGDDPTQGIKITLQEYSDFYQSLAIPCIISYTLTFILGVTGNSLVIWIAGFKMKSISAVWFLNLAITDLICNSALLLRITEWSMVVQSNTFNNSLCKVSTSLMFFNMLTSVYFLTVISIDRCVSVWWPLWSKIHRTRRLARIISVYIWWICLIITTPYVAFYNYTNFVSDCNVKIIDLMLKSKKHKARVIFNPKLVLMFVFPFMVILISYSLIVLKLRTLKRHGGSQRPFKVITSVVVCFFICWCPYNIWPFIPLSTNYWKARNILREVSICLAYFNSCINPIIYVFSSPDFKANFTIKSLPARLKNAFIDSDEVDSENIKTCTSLL
ncbi:C3a anaphylatoxin chemotactic receptor-like [Pelobates fuscus]|uniref:C3a anaphylatoxin chemotactic receptor-like n=1 Tax=Pelobates fuscus TaxID=191477 RepID=UPI002FE448CE